MSSRPWVVGLTGGIGSGKSAVAERLARHGAHVVDTDALAHELTGPDGAAMPAIRARFGDAVIASDGRLDRAAMRARVFADPDERRALESILHPMIRDASEAALVSDPAAAAPYAVLVIPLLVESGRPRDRCDRVLVVDCDPALQIERVIARSGLARDEAERIVRAQVDRATRLAAADDIVDNGGTRAQLAAAVDALHARYVDLARGRGR
jgi:dephospho-CoA kinase